MKSVLGGKKKVELTRCVGHAPIDLVADDDLVEDACRRAIGGALQEAERVAELGGDVGGLEVDGNSGERAGRVCEFVLGAGEGSERCVDEGGEVLGIGSGTLLRRGGNRVVRAGQQQLHGLRFAVDRGEIVAGNEPDGADDEGDGIADGTDLAGELRAADEVGEIDDLLHRDRQDAEGAAIGDVLKRREAAGVVQVAAKGGPEVQRGVDAGGDGGDLRGLDLEGGAQNAELGVDDGARVAEGVGVGHGLGLGLAAGLSLLQGPRAGC